MLESRFKHPIVASALLSALEELLLLYSFRFSTFGEWGFEFDLAVTYFSKTPLLFDYYLPTICPPLFGSSSVCGRHQYGLRWGRKRCIPKKRDLWTAHDTGIIALLFVEGIAAFVQCVDLDGTFSW